MEQDAFPWIGRLPIASIKAPTVLECLRRVEARGAIETAHRVKQACGQVFRYGVAIGVRERDPTTDLREALTPVHVKHHAAITDPQRTGELLRAVASYRGHAVTRAALQLAALTFQRPSERMKRSKVGKASGVPHLVPLSRGRLKPQVQHPNDPETQYEIR